MRLILTVVCVFIAGAAIGGGILHFQEQGKQDELLNSINAYKTEITTLDKNLKQLTLSLTQLESENERLSDLAEMDTQDAQFTQRMPFDLDMPLEQLDAAVSSETNEPEDDNSSTEDSEEEEDRQRRDERRQQFAQDMRNRMNERLDAQWEDADAETKERITALAEYQDAMFETGMQMRNAETDEEREALQAVMRENMQAMREINREQQNYMIKNLARDFGITGEDTGKFNTDMRGILSDPLFNMGSMGPGGFRGGFGGGGFGGGRAGRGNDRGRPRGGNSNR